MPVGKADSGSLRASDDAGYKKFTEPKRATSSSSRVRTRLEIASLEVRGAHLQTHSIAKRAGMNGGRSYVKWKFPAVRLVLVTLSSVTVSLASMVNTVLAPTGWRRSSPP